MKISFPFLGVSTDTDMRSFKIRTDWVILRSRVITEITKNSTIFSIEMENILKGSIFSKHQHCFKKSVPFLGLVQENGIHLYIDVLLKYRYTTWIKTVWDLCDVLWFVLSFYDYWRTLDNGLKCTLLFLLHDIKWFANWWHIHWLSLLSV